MVIALWLLALQGAIGAFDTLYYHEWQARLPGRGRAAARELQLHAARDVLYAALFATLPWIAWRGGWALGLAGIVVAEIVLTLWDFVVEVEVRRKLGGVAAGERVTHAVMGILYGAVLANLSATVLDWWQQPTGLVFDPPSIPAWLRGGLSLLAVGVLASGVRDVYAALELPHGSWPWAARAGPP